MPKKEYRVCNWKEYNQALVSRGSITLWFDEAAIKDWHPAKTGKRGRPLGFSHTAIECGLTLKAIYGLPFRSVEGFLSSLIELLGLDISAPDYSLLCKRQKQVQVNLCKRKHVPGEALHLLIDSTGLTVFGEGEWKVRQHGWVKHRLWRKLHVGFNEQTQEIEAFALTDLGVQDCAGVPLLLDQINQDVDSIRGDGAYDRYRCYEDAARRGIDLITPPQKNARTSKERTESKKKASVQAVENRDAIVERVREIGRVAWKVEKGYHRRSLAETGMFRIKQLLGSRLTAKKMDNQTIEVAIWLKIINQMTAQGMPVSVAIN